MGAFSGARRIEQERFISEQGPEFRNRIGRPQPGTEQVGSSTFGGNIFFAIDETIDRLLAS